MAGQGRRRDVSADALTHERADDIGVTAVNPVLAQSGVMVLNINPFHIATSNGLDLMIGGI